jgi:hypothetical protein
VGKVCKIREQNPAYQPIYTKEIAFLKTNLNFVNTLNEIEIDNNNKFDIFLHIFHEYLTVKPECTNQVKNNTFTLQHEFYNKIEELSTASQNISDDQLYNLYVQFLELNFWCYYKLQDGKTIEGDTNAQLTNTLSDNQKTVIKLIQAMYLKQ